MLKGPQSQRGQAFLLVLILLATGTLLIVPTLRLIGTAAKGSEVATREVKSLYYADGSQEWIMWKLTYEGLASTFTTDGERRVLSCNVCGETVDVELVMQAVEGEGGVDLAGEDVIQPTKSVAPSSVPDGSLRTYTYTIRMEQVSNDNSVGLDAVFDILPDEFDASDYVAGSSTISVDGGPPTSIADPAIEVTGGQVRLKWPSTYDPVTETGGFTSPIRDFKVRQVKELSFQVRGTLLNNRTYYNWVVLKPWNTLSGPDGEIVTGNGNTPEGGLIQVSKTADPELIQPGVVTEVEYVISITNLQGSTERIQAITDYLPYIAGSAGFDGSSLTTVDPQVSLENLNGQDRWVLRWTTTELGGERSIGGG
jgi:hypothetical protein